MCSSDLGPFRRADERKPPFHHLRLRPAVDDGGNPAGLQNAINLAPGFTLVGKLQMMQRMQRDDPVNRLRRKRQIRRVADDKKPVIADSLPRFEERRQRYIAAEPIFKLFGIRQVLGRYNRFILSVQAVSA